jgi:serine/threonine protein kinase
MTTKINPIESIGDRRTAIVSMTALIEQMRNAVLSKARLTENDFAQILNGYKELASPSSTNKTDKAFIHDFNNRFAQICKLAAEETRNAAIHEKEIIDWNNENKKFDLATSAPDEKTGKVLASFISSLISEYPEYNFVEKALEYDCYGRNLKFAQNLMKINDKFYVISNKEEDSFGKGAFSRIRKVTASFEVTLDGSIQWQQETDLGVRITNTQYAQAKHVKKQTVYQHQDAIDSYIKAQPFTHYGLQEPIEVIKASKTIKDEEGNEIESGDFSKSYSLVNLLPGKDYDKACKNYLQTPRTTKDILDFVVLPLLETYEKQIPNHLSHSDLKPENILITIGNEKESTIVNFIDFDFRQIIGEISHTKGTMGYIPPETSKQETIVAASRDMFPLGVLCNLAFNPDLEPQALLINIYDCDGYNARKKFDELLQLNKHQPSYDAKAILAASNDLFGEKKQKINEEIAENEQEIAFYQNVLASQTKQLLGNLTPDKRAKLEDDIENTKSWIVHHESVIQNDKQLKISAKYTHEELAANLFKYVHDKEPIPVKQREKIRDLFNQMTSYDENKRPLKVKIIIEQFKDISFELAVQQEKSAVKTHANLFQPGVSQQVERKDELVSGMSQIFNK